MILNEGINCSVETIPEDISEGVDERSEENKESWKFRIDKFHEKNYPPFLNGCIYRGEGNANLVLALPSERKVVRFRKSSPSSESSPDGGRARTIREIEFLKYVISGFLGDYIQPPEPLRVNPEDMIKVSEAIQPLRPEYRRRKHIVEDYATIFADYAFLPNQKTASLSNYTCKPTFCVEIKPKQGFRHELDEQFKKCSYCLTQYYKLETGAIKTRSSYCPYDLFSGDIERMKKSIRRLVESPQNNFKIFKNGSVVYHSDSKDRCDVENIFTEWFSTGGPRSMEENFEIFFEIISAALLKEFPSSNLDTKLMNGKILGLSSLDLEQEPRIDQDIVFRAKKILNLNKDECNFARNGVPQGCVLGRILKMQQLPYHSADLVYKIYSKHFATLNDEAVYSQMIKIHKGKNKASVSNGKKMLKREDLLHSSKAANCRISDTNGNENSSRTRTDFRNNNNRQIGESEEEKKASITIPELEALQNYLIVTTAKDCSILIAFQEIDSMDLPDKIPPEMVIQTTKGVNFMVNIGVLDLDPKSIHCIEKHRRRDTNVLISLSNVLEKKLDFRNELQIDPA